MADTSPQAVSYFVLPLIATTGERGTINVGTCVVIAAAKRRAIALTAFHVIDYVIKSHDSVWSNEMSVSPHFRRSRYGERFGVAEKSDAPALPTFFVAMPHERCFASVLNVSAFGGDELDIACLWLEIPLIFEAEFTARCAFRSHGPQIGESVQLCGYPEGNSFEAVESGEGLNFKFEVTRLVNSGTVDSKFGWKEDFLVRSPGMVIDVPSPSGFSGGAVIVNDPVGGPAVAGIISSSDGVVTKAAAIWPALGLEHSVPSDGTVPTTLLGMLQDLPHALTDHDDGAKHVRVHPDKANVSLREYITWA